VLITEAKKMQKGMYEDRYGIIYNTVTLEEHASVGMAVLVRNGNKKLISTEYFIRFINSLWFGVPEFDSLDLCSGIPFEFLFA
jgi:hypothetical protein